MDKKNSRIWIRLNSEIKEKWKKRCKENNCTLTELVVSSVEKKISSSERKNILIFIEKQGNIFAKIENNINQFAKVANTNKVVTSFELDRFTELVKEVEMLKIEQNKIIKKIYRILSKD